MFDTINRARVYGLLVASYWLLVAGCWLDMCESDVHLGIAIDHGVRGNCHGNPRKTFRVTPWQSQ